MNRRTERLRAAIAFGTMLVFAAPISADPAPSGAIVQAERPDPASKPRASREALYVAIEKFDATALREQLALGLDIDSSGPRAVSPLVAAIDLGNVDAVRLLLAKGANANPSAKGESPLFRAIQQNSVECVTLLLDAGADIQHGRTSTETALVAAMRPWRSLIVAQLLRAGGDPFTEIRGERLIHAAAIRGDTEVIGTLLAKGEDIDRPMPGLGATALIRACQAGAPTAVRAVLQFHPNVNAKDRAGRTALMHAAERGPIETCQLLVAAGADVRLSTSTHETAYLLAGQHGYSAIVELLRQAGAEPEPLRLPQLWRSRRLDREPFAIAMGAFELYYRGGSPAFFPDRSRPSILAQEELGRLGIRTAEDLPQKLNELMTGGSEAGGESEVAKLSDEAFAARIDAVLDDPVKVLALKQARERGKLSRDASLAWRLCHHNYLAIVAVTAGYLDQDDALRRMARAAKALQADYRSWSEVSAALVEGIKATESDHARVDSLATLFLNEDDPASPWTRYPFPPKS